MHHHLDEIPLFCVLLLLFLFFFAMLTNNILGSQYSHLILRRLRDMGVYCEMLACDVKFANLPFKPKGIILSGG